MYWKKTWVLKKNVRFWFRKLMKVGRSTETVRLKVSACVDAVELVVVGEALAFEIQVASTPQFDLVQSSAKSIEKPSTLRFW